MKKILKKIMVLVVAATLLVIPTSTALAEVIPVTVSYFPGGGSSIYQYQPSPYVLHPGYSMMLHNYGNPSQLWDVKAGNNVIFSVITKYLGPVSGKLVVVDTSNGSTVASNQFTTAEDYYCIDILLPALNTDKKYTMFLIAYTDIFVDEYLYVCY